MTYVLLHGARGRKPASSHGTKDNARGLLGARGGGEEGGRRALAVSLSTLSRVRTINEYWKSIVDKRDDSGLSRIIRAMQFATSGASTRVTYLASRPRVVRVISPLGGRENSLPLSLSFLFLRSSN